MMNLKKFVTLALLSSVAFVGNVFADEMVEKLKGDVAKTIQSWAQDPKIVSAIKAQNAKHSGLSQSEIDNLDKQWRAETESASKPLIDAILNNELSAHLKGIKSKHGDLYFEIFVMDNKGLVVGESDMTSDYWQGDEGKWQNSYGKGAGAIEVGEVEFDDSSQQFQSQVSVTITDESGSPVGAVTVGINVDKLS